MKKIGVYKLCPYCGLIVKDRMRRGESYLCRGCKQFFYPHEAVVEKNVPKREKKKRKGRGWIGKRIYLVIPNYTENNSD